MDFSTLKTSLKTCPRFAGLDEVSLAILFWRAQERTEPFGTKIYTENSPCDDTFGVLVDGGLRFVRGGTVIASSRGTPPEVFGETALFATGARRTATVEVTSPNATYLLIRLEPKDRKVGPFADVCKRLSLLGWETRVEDSKRELV